TFPNPGGTSCGVCSAGAAASRCRESRTPKSSSPWRALGASSCESDVPIGRAVGPVRAEDAGSDRILEVSAERRVLLRDPCDRIADATGHRLAGAIGHVARLAHPPAGAVGGRQLLGEELDLL